MEKKYYYLFIIYPYICIPYLYYAKNKVLNNLFHLYLHALKAICNVRKNLKDVMFISEMEQLI